MSAARRSPARRRLPRGRRLALAASLGLVVLAGCGGNGAEPGAGEASGPRVYEVRGVLRAMPDGDGAADELMIHHEAIPGFAGIDGRMTDMQAMTMPFPAAAGLDLTGLEAGDKVAFRLEVDWEATPAAAIVAIEKLPPDSELDLGAGN